MNSLLLEAMQLKQVDRAGWLRAGIEHPESVAAHTWGVSLLVLALADDRIDRDRAVRIALVHDLAEVRVGDITPYDGIEPAAKHAMEREAAETMFEDHPEFFKLWLEYEEGTTPEARFVKDCDKLDMAIQATHYSREHSVDTSEFIASAGAGIEHPNARNMFTKLC